MRQGLKSALVVSKILICLAVLSISASAADDGQTTVGSTDFLGGKWRILDTDENEIGHSTILVQVPGAMLFEERTIGDRGPQPLWLMNSEKNGGWTQLFVGPNGVREFPPQSPPGKWPLVVGAPVTLQSGEKVTFRMTISRESDDKTRRVLEISKDDAATWKTVFDYTYVRTAQ